MPCNAPHSPARAWAQAESRARWIDVDTDTDTATDIASQRMQLPAACMRVWAPHPRAAPMRSRAPLQTSWREAIALVEQSEYHRFTAATKARAKKARRCVTRIAARPPGFGAACGRLAALDQLSTERKAVQPPSPPRRSGYSWCTLLPVYTYRIIYICARSCPGAEATSPHCRPPLAPASFPLAHPPAQRDTEALSPRCRGTRCTASRRARHRFHPPRPVDGSRLPPLPQRRMRAPVRVCE
jgi:hypothetical protein